MNSRRALMTLLASILMMEFGGCNAQDQSKRSSMKYVVLDLVLFNYQNRPIFDVYLSEKWAGGAAAYGGGGGGITGVSIPLGPQTLTWRDAGTGQTFVAKNPLVITVDQIPSDAHYLGIHIYPDETVEFSFAKYLPEMTSRGREIFEEAQKNGQ